MGIFDDQIKNIYAPVQNHLDHVVDKLEQFATDAGGSFIGDSFPDALGTGGKKIRPAITLLAAFVYDQQSDSPIVMATAVELLHIATLIHDDTVDMSKKRRGVPTVNSLWGTPMAVLLGDYVFATSATYVCDTGNIRVIRRFSETIMELAQGEMVENLSKYNWDQTIGDYQERIYKKTASLFMTAAESGAVLSGAPESVCQDLKRYGYNLGMAFQIMDDILDFEGTEEELGKPVGNDLLSGVLTLPSLLFIKDHPNEPAMVQVRNGSRDRSDLKRVIDSVLDSDAMNKTVAVMEKYHEAACDALSGLPQSEIVQSLNQLAQYVIQRRR
jgi:heptaprenyl diphosphate synthase